LYGHAQAGLLDVLESGIAASLESNGVDGDNLDGVTFKLAGVEGNMTINFTKIFNSDVRLHHSVSSVGLSKTYVAVCVCVCVCVCCVILSVMRLLSQGYTWMLVEGVRCGRGRLVCD
jgi:hypothetical protein